MKKFGYLLLAALMMSGVTACSNDDNKPGEATETVSGFYTVNGGNKSGKIPASITAYDYASGASTDPLEDAFFAANNIALGDGAQQAIVCEGKMYIAMYTSNLIWVVDPVSLKIITSIQPEGDAKSPRALAAKDGKVYCSMYTGYVTKIDAKTDKIEASVQVGANPDGIAVAGNKLIVANTDGMNSKNGYANNGISVIDLATFTQKEIKNTKFPGNHSTEAASDGTNAFVVMQGSYKAPDEEGYVPAIIVKIAGDTENDFVKVCDGTNLSVCNNNLYVINAQWKGKPADRTYNLYDASTLALKGDFVKMQEGGDSYVLAPNGVFADPVSGDIVILSYYVDEAKGTSLTREPCYANIYDKNGDFRKRIRCGVGARGVTFVHSAVK